MYILVEECDANGQRIAFKVTQVDIFPALPVENGPREELRIM